MGVSGQKASVGCGRGPWKQFQPQMLSRRRCLRFSPGPQGRSAPKASVTCLLQEARPSQSLSGAPLDTRHCVFDPVYYIDPAYRSQPPCSAEKINPIPRGKTKTQGGLGHEPSCVSKAWVCPTPPVLQLGWSDQGPQEGSGGSLRVCELSQATRGCKRANLGAAVTQQPAFARAENSGRYTQAR